MQKKKLVVVNFKMNLATLTENEYWLDNFFRAKKDFVTKQTELVLCPSLIFWDVFLKRINKDDWVSLGAQNCFWEDKGAFTGEVGPQMLKSREGKYVIVGHSERRKYLKETDEENNLKIATLLKNGLVPIFCLGESWEERKVGLTWKVISSQLKKGLENIRKNQAEKIVFCYEPVWAISANNSGKIPSNNEVMEARLMIKKSIKECYDEKVAEKVLVIYGGSVDEKNLQDVCLSAGMEGVLLGKTGLLVYELLKIVKKMEE